MTFAPLPDPVEAADSTSPGAFGFKIDDGRLTHPYYVGEEVEDYVLGILGYYEQGNDGRIARTLPRAHPAYPFLFASSVNGIGYGVPRPHDADRLAAEPIAARFAIYPNSTVTVEFLQRPYEVLPDDEITVRGGTWHDPDGLERQYRYADEWERFTEIDETWDPKVLTATQGQLAFHTAQGQGEAAAGAAAFAAPHKLAFPGSPRFPMPEFMLKVTWRGVPYRYVSSRKSYLKSLSHHVNQHAWRLQDYRFEPGELLYYGYAYRRYTQPFPARDLFSASGFALEKWLDVEMTFGVAYRQARSAPVLTNPNWIPHGHNALLWPGPTEDNLAGKRRGFYYASGFRASAAADASYWAPLFHSAPLQLLFMDPDVAQPGIPLTLAGL